MFSRVTQVGASAGVRFNWDAVRVAPNSAASHALIDWAPSEKKGAVVAAIHRAYFEQGLNLGDPNVLASLARETGLDEAGARAAVTDGQRLAAVRASADEASRRGITGVPFFVIGGRTLNGAQSPEELRAAISQGASTRQ
jgi:predicted DsbA family dithiol-disulfide isomerase